MDSDHRAKAVEAALDSLMDTRPDPPEGEALAVVRQDVSEALDAAEPHLQRMYFERLREVVLGEAAVQACVERAGTEANPTHRNMVRRDLRTALDKAQELMEGEQ